MQIAGRRAAASAALIVAIAAGGGGLAGAARAQGAGAAPPPAVAAAAAPSAAASAPPVEQFFAPLHITSAHLSPSGRQVAITRRVSEDAVQLQVVDVGSDAPPQRVAGFRDAQIVRVAWAGDDRLLYSVVDTRSGSGHDHRVGPGLYSVRVDGRDTQLLIRRTHLPTSSLADARRARALAPNHRLLRVPAVQPESGRTQVVIGAAERGEDGSLAWVPMWLDVRSGVTREMDLDGAPRAAQQWWFDPQGVPRLARTERQGQIRLHWRGPGDAAWRVLFTAPALHLPFSPVAVGANGTLYVQHAHPPAGEAVLTRYDFERGAPATPPLAAWPGFDVRTSLVVETDSGRLLGVRGEAERERTLWFDAGEQPLQQRIDALLPDRVNRIECRRCASDEAVALVTSLSDQDPGQIYVYQAATRQLLPLGALRPEVDPARMGRVQFHRIRARDGLSLPVWLTLPAGAAPGQARPAVVLAHDGPWRRGGHWRWEAMAQFLASRGWLVIQPEFRGSDGYGQAHLRAGFRQWGQAMQDDLADALHWARAQGLAGERACIVGGRYGGYAALMGLVRDPALYRCGAAWSAISDPLLLLQGPWWLDDDIADSLRRHRLPELVGDPVKDAEALAGVTPWRHAARIQGAVLLAHGGMDSSVPPLHGERMRDALVAAGQAPEWVLYGDEAETFRRLDHRLDFGRRLEAFLRRHLDGPAP